MPGRRWCVATSASCTRSRAPGGSPTTTWATSSRRCSRRWSRACRACATGGRWCAGSPPRPSGRRAPPPCGLARVQALAPATDPELLSRHAAAEPDVGADLERLEQQALLRLALAGHRCTLPRAADRAVLRGPGSGLRRAVPAPRGAGRLARAHPGAVLPEDARGAGPRGRRDRAWYHDAGSPHLWAWRNPLSGTRPPGADRGSAAAEDGRSGMSKPTRRTSGPRRHLDLARILDYLEDRLSPEAAREVEEHLAAPCSDCREHMRQAGVLVERMRHDRVPEVPEVVRRRALDVFVPSPARAPAAGSPSASPSWCSIRCAPRCPPPRGARSARRGACASAR